MPKGNQSNSSASEPPQPEAVSSPAPTPTRSSAPSAAALPDLFTRATAPAPADPRTFPRVLLLFAHPDDETVALGARLANFAAAHLVHVTDGTPRDDPNHPHRGFASLHSYRNARATELAAVLAAAGLAQVSRECLRVPVQEAAFSLVALTRTVQRILRQHAPEVIFTHPYEGGHPDHDACAFAVHHAVQLRPSEARPLILECAFYHAGSRVMEAGDFLSFDDAASNRAAPPQAADDPSPSSLTPSNHAAPNHAPADRHASHSRLSQAEFRLTPDERRSKRRLLGLFASQSEPLARVPTLYERFRIAPPYEFRNPPHPAPLLYDTQSGGITSQQFSQLARDAERTSHSPDVSSR